MTSRRGRREPLDRDAIIDAAVALADREGVVALSMRKLAGQLGYGVMSLYNHVANKDELLALMVDAVAAEVADPPADTPPLAAVRDIAISTREAFVAHPWVPELWLRYRPGPARIHCMETLLRVLAASDLSSDLAHHAFHAVNNHVLGYTLQERAMAEDIDDPEAAARQFLDEVDTGEQPHVVGHVRQHLDGDTGSSFELVLDLILDGLVRLDESGTSR